MGSVNQSPTELLLHFMALYSCPL
uniref:Uncharacterized protein n=1 Tax=Anguilla anguilla TaxID=7936 RepID=A0A0E9VNM8_ANGAN